jgi:Leucine-rich repeat (LRR) protein
MAVLQPNLNLNAKRLTVLPDLSATAELRSLSADNNQLRHIPDNVSLLTRLEELSLYCNHLEQLPSLQSLRSLRGRESS